MKKLMLALVLTVIAGVANAKGASGVAHAAVASHIPAHISSHQNHQANVGPTLSGKEQITITATLIAFVAISITAFAFSGE